MFGLCAVALVGGAQLNPVLLARFSQTRVAGTALVCVVTTGLVGVVFQSAGATGNATSLAMSRHGEVAGTAAAVVGAVQFGVGALFAPLVGLLGNDSTATATSMALSAALALVALAVAALRRRGSAAAGPIAAAEPVAEPAREPVGV